MKGSILIFCILVTHFSFGQNVNPWKSIGKDAPEILTLTNGKYPEIFENDSIRIIGNIIYNIRLQKIIGFIEKDTTYSEATLEPSVVSRWLSRDPLAAKFPSMSPYNFVANNPIQYIDPDGKEFVDANGNKVTVTMVKISDNSYRAVYDFKNGTDIKTKERFQANAGRVINTLIQIKTGRELVEKANTLEDKINIYVSSNETEKGELGVTKNLLNKNGDVVGSKVIIYEGNIETVPVSSEQGKEYSENKMTAKQKIAKTGAHELFHATNENDTRARKDKRKLTKEEHQEAKDVGKKASKEFGELNKKTND